jgi:hypothetical protein
MEINIKKMERERGLLGLSKYAFSKKIGIHHQNYDYILKAKQTKLPTIQKIADFLGIDGKDLLI